MAVRSSVAFPSSAWRNSILLCVLGCVLLGCIPQQSVPLNPKVEYTASVSDIRRLPTPFSPLTPEECQESWADEYRVGVHFARDLDLYRAITAFKRAFALLPAVRTERLLEVQYFIAYSYYLGHKYHQAVETFEQTALCGVTSQFAAFEDLLIVLSDSYEQCGNSKHAALLRDLLKVESASKGECLELSSILRRADLCELSRLAQTPGSPPLASVVVNNYCLYRKSVKRAQQLNTLLPGLGYWYVGQRQSAVTAFLLNALFIAATYQFFHRGYWAAGAFTASLEAGWYFGGIYGAGEAAHTYNRILYQEMIGPTLRQQRLHPMLMLRFGF